MCGKDRGADEQMDNQQVKEASESLWKEMEQRSVPGLVGVGVRCEEIVLYVSKSPDKIPSTWNGFNVVVKRVRRARLAAMSGDDTD